MKIGPYELHAIDTGRFALDGGAMFGVVPKPLWNKTNPADEQNRIELALRALLIVGKGRVILVDTGIGTKFNEKQRAIYKVDHSRFDLASSLRKVGVSFAEITHVILTHLHFDHAGGATTLEGGRLKPTFPNATYIVQRRNFEWALNPSERDRASYFRDDFAPLKEHGVLELRDGTGELFPNIALEVVNGHTPGQQLVRISDGRATLLYCADLVPTTSHLALPYIMAYDLFPLTTLEEKKTYLCRASDEEWTLFFEHDPDTEAARVKRGGKGFEVAGAVTM